MPNTRRRTVYGKAGVQTPLWAWIFQRVSGLLLGPLIVIHVLVPRGAFIDWASALLLVIVLGHAAVALWRYASRRGGPRALAKSGVFLTAVYVVVLGVLGVALIASV
jgi:succinate dehydrogenase hydrophobic anchor subunit